MQSYHVRGEPMQGAIGSMTDAAPQGATVKLGLTDMQMRSI